MDGVGEVLDDLAALADDVTHLAGVLADEITSLANSHNPTRSRIAGRPVVSGNRAVVSYAGVLYPAGFTARVAAEIPPAATQALQAGVDNLIDQKGLS